METGGTRRFAPAMPLHGQASPEWCGLGLAGISEADGCNGRNNSARVNALVANGWEGNGNAMVDVMAGHDTTIS